MAHNGGPATPGLLHQQLDTPSRVDEITDRLITAIAIGEYLPGARLRSNVTSPRHWGQGA